MPHLVELITSCLYSEWKPTYNQGLQNRKITDMIISISEHNIMYYNKLKLRYYMCFSIQKLKKKTWISSEPMAAIFILTIASLVVPWWTSTSVAPCVSAPTNSVQVRPSPDIKLPKCPQSRCWIIDLSHCTAVITLPQSHSAHFY